VEIDGPAEEYAARLRAVLGAALDRAVGAMDLDYVDDPDSLGLDVTVPAGTCSTGWRGSTGTAPSAPGSGGTSPAAASAP
jgi:hypothetical protein